MEDSSSTYPLPLWGLEPPRWEIAFDILWCLVSFLALLVADSISGRFFWGALLAAGLVSLAATKIPPERTQLRRIAEGLPFFTICVVFAASSSEIWTRLFFGLIAVVLLPFFFLHLKDGTISIKPEGILINRLWVKRNIPLGNIAAIRPHTSRLAHSFRDGTTVVIELKAKRSLLSWWKEQYRLSIPPELAPAFIEEVKQRLATANSTS